jgi:fibronectin type 3 domain-containing protein
MPGHCTIAALRQSGMQRVVLLLALAGAVTLEVACGGADKSTGISSTTAATVVLSPAPSAVQLDSVLTLTATVKNASGDTLSGQTLTWTSSNTSVATVSGAGQTGRVSGVAAGTSIVTATSAIGPSAVDTVIVSNPTTPAVPASVATTVVSGHVQLAWVAVSGATTYNVSRSTTSGSGYTALGTSTASPYTDTSSLAAGITYYYVVQGCVDGTICSASSAQASAALAPSPPTSLAATAGTDQVGLTWTGSTGATSYEVFRGTSAGAESGTALATTTAATYIDTSAVAGTPYYYKVEACDAGGCSAGGNEATATPTSPTPAVPTGLSVTPEPGRDALVWTASSGATSYKVFRGTSSGGEGVTPLTTVTTASFTDSTATVGHEYFYTVEACNSSACSAASNEVSATVVPADVTAVSAAPGGSAGSGWITVSWAASTGATLYNLYVANAYGDFTTAAAGGSGTTLTIHETSGSGPWYFGVTACDGGGCSGFGPQEGGPVTAP